MFEAGKVTFCQQDPHSDFRPGGMVHLTFCCYTDSEQGSSVTVP